MEQAALDERNRKAAEAAEASRKRSVSALSDEANEAKRVKTAHPNTSVSGILSNFDFASLPASLVTELIVANLQVLTEQSLATAIQVSRNAHFRRRCFSEGNYLKGLPSSTRVAGTYSCPS
jgi:symplekin